MMTVCNRYTTAVEPAAHTGLLFLFARLTLAAQREKAGKGKSINGLRVFVIAGLV